MVGGVWGVGDRRRHTAPFEVEEGSERGMRPLCDPTYTPGGGEHTSRRGVLGLALGTTKICGLSPGGARSGARQRCTRDRRADAADSLGGGLLLRGVLCGFHLFSSVV